MEPEKSFYAVVPLSFLLLDRLDSAPAHLSVHQTKKEMFSRSNNEGKLVKLCDGEKEQDKKWPFRIT